MNTKQQYANFAKPSWAPPSWVFGPVWTVLYTIIAITFGFVAFQYAQGHIPLLMAAPFALNLLFNILYTPIQFGIRSFTLAAIDIIFVLATLVWALISIYVYYPWIAYANVPYLVWVSFATLLQLTLWYRNRSRQ